jgi:hypothetical protein
MRERDHLEDPGIDRWIILKLIFRKWDRGWGGMDWIGLAQNRKRWQSLVLVGAVMNLRVP